ncbi:MAG: transglutaminase-like domain-containing protein [Lachnospiraceae bacterium]|nr:transglutaminase-like domain-containing protein [Lachnospiraceae bacterium]
MHLGRHSLTSYFVALMLILCIFIYGCGGSSGSESSASASASTSSGGSSAESSSNDSSSTDTTDTTDTNSKGTRDNTAHVLSPEASQVAVQTNDAGTVTLDSSNAGEGYVMIDYSGTNEKVKMQLTGPDAVTYTYTLHNGYDTFPLTSGSGSYNITVFENIEGDQYSTALTANLSVEITNEFGAYLYPNQYVNYAVSSQVASLSEELAYPANDDLEVVTNVYNYIISNFTYDYDKAASVQSGYLPVIDSTLNDKTGICFDYAAVTASLLRIQGIPTRLEIGYVGEVYHAWISIYTAETGWINGIIEFHGTNWELMDPTFASTSKKPMDFITEPGDYSTKYVY